MRRRQGFTLVELLMIIATIGVLISVTFPAISGTQEAARRAASLSNLRQCLGIALAYTADYDAMMPCYTDPSLKTVRIVRWNGPWLLVHMRSEHMWNLALADAYLGGRPANGACFSPHESDSPRRYPYYGPARLLSDYVYSCTFQAAPEFFAPETRWKTGKSQLRAVRTNEVTYPSYKAVFTDRYRSAHETAENAWEMGFTDGSAAVAQHDNLGPQYGWPYKGDWWSGKSFDFGHEANEEQGMHTLHGCRGRDVFGR